MSTGEDVPAKKQGPWGKINAKLDQLCSRERAATKAPWFVATGCSWRRILQAGTDKPVIVPTNLRDGYPDLAGGLNDLELACESRNRYGKLLDALKQLSALAQESDSISSTGIRRVIEDALLSE